jgi:mono/diheme cytochrome c family protein
MRRALAIGFCSLAVATALAVPVAADDRATFGRRIFGRGGEAGEVTAAFAGTNTPLPSGVRRCAGCHGPDAAGAREGGVEIPAVTWTALAAPRDALPGRPGRPGYDEVTLERALAEGIDPAGRTLASSMPRFRLTPAQVAALFDYLRIVGTERDLDPGIAADEIRVGAVLPLSGAQAARGQAMRIGLERALSTAGPIYGRRLRLIAADAGDDAAAALRRLAASDQVFALVATMSPTEAAPDTEPMPVIGPLAPTPGQFATNQFYLLASIEDQMRVLVDELASEMPHPLRLAVIGPEGRVADAVVDQAARNGAIIVRGSSAEDLTAVLPPLVEPFPDAVLALPGVDFVRLVAELADRRGDWLLAGPAEAVTPGAAIDERLRLVLPILPADPQGRDPSVATAIPPLAVAAAAVFVEGLKRMGARASRAGLIAAIETLRDFPTGVLPPLNFGRGQHTGNHASLVIRPDRRQGIIVLGGWRAPR